MEALIALLAACAGLLAGWLVGSRRTGNSHLRAALAESAGLRATLAAEQGAARYREQLLVQSDGQRRDVLGAEAAEALEQVQRQLVDLQQGRAGSDAALREQVSMMTATSERLRTETEQLVTALRAPQVRGRWGEMQLERVVEAAGMTDQIDYVTQVTATGSGPSQRPDLVVRLTGGRQVVVDSKVAFAAYLEAMQATDEAPRDARFKAHARSTCATTSTVLRRSRTGSASRRHPSSWSASSPPMRSSTPPCARIHCYWSMRSVRTSCWRHRRRSSPCFAPSPTDGVRSRWPPTPQRSMHSAVTSTSGSARWAATSNGSAEALAAPSTPTTTRSDLSNGGSSPLPGSWRTWA